MKPGRLKPELRNCKQLTPVFVHQKKRPPYRGCRSLC